MSSNRAEVRTGNIVVITAAPVCSAHSCSRLCYFIERWKVDTASEIRHFHSCVPELQNALSGSLIHYEVASIPGTHIVGLVCVTVVYRGVTLHCCGTTFATSVRNYSCRRTREKKTI